MKYWTIPSGKMKAPEKNIVALAVVGVLITIWLAQHGGSKTIQESDDTASFIENFGV